MSFGSVLGGVVGFAVGGPVGAAAGAAIGGSKPAANTATAAGNAVSDVVDVTGDVFGGVGKVFISAGRVVLDAVGDLAASALSVAYGTVAFRSLRPSERAVANEVFGFDANVMPLDRVVLCSAGGIGNRQFTIPGSLLAVYAAKIPAIGPALLVEVVIRHLWDKYIIFMGMDGYNNGINSSRDRARKRLGQTIAHELTHVWQGHHQLFSWSYMINSVYNQCVVCVLDGTSAYTYTIGKQWQDYHAEEQAMIVEDWFANHTSGGDSNILWSHQPYIDSNIRTGLPHAQTKFPVVTVLNGPLSRVEPGSRVNLSAPYVTYVPPSTPQLPLSTPYKIKPLR